VERLGFNRRAFLEQLFEGGFQKVVKRDFFELGSKDRIFF
jgi:hypothetical protein